MANDVLHILLIEDNALKHARVNNIVIRLDQKEKELTLKVEDDGVGMPQKARPVDGMSLRTMKYRAQLVGATLVIHRGDRCGTIVNCALSR